MWQQVAIINPLTFFFSSQKDLPSEEIKTGEEDDEDDNGDNLLKESNDSECQIISPSIFDNDSLNTDFHCLEICHASFIREILML